MNRNSMHAALSDYHGLIPLLSDMLDHKNCGQKHTRGGGGGLVRAYFGTAKFGEGKFWTTMDKCGTNFPNNGQYRNGTGDL